jgi:hypothetical protein
LRHEKILLPRAFVLNSRPARSGGQLRGVLAAREMQPGRGSALAEIPAYPPAGFARQSPLENSSSGTA